MSHLRIVPLELKEANAIVSRWHRHHVPVVGHRFSVGVCDESGVLHGAAIVGRPVARMTDAKTTVEVTRLVTDGTKHACSMLYAAAARACAAMGYLRIQTFILDYEPGTSLLAAGWMHDGDSAGGAWEHTAGRQRLLFHDGATRRRDQPTCPKQRWSKQLGRALPVTKVVV